MSEKRKPTIKIVAEKRGKRNRIELFPAELFVGVRKSGCRTARYRVRINGRWHGGKEKVFLTRTDVMDQIRRLICR